MCPCSVRVDTCRSGWCPGYLGPAPRRSPRTRQGQLHSPPAPLPTGATRCASSLSSPPPVLRLPASAQRATLGPRCTPVAGKPVIERREDEPIDLAAPPNSSKSALRLEQQRRAAGGPVPRGRPDLESCQPSSGPRATAIAGGLAPEE